MSNDMKDGLGDGEVELSAKALLGNPDSSSVLHSPASTDSFLDEFLNSTRTCTHTHTCNPPGPEANHTHICFHTHTQTQIISSEENDNPSSKDHSNSKSRRRPSGNKEAVRKYREKKKAHTAYLEEEAQKLRVLNRQLLKKLQGQAVLEAETSQLRSLLVDLRGRIDIELGLFPFEKLSNPATISRMQPMDEPIGMQCQTGTPNFHQLAGSSAHASIDGSHKLMESWKEESCQPARNDCQTNNSNNNSMADAEGLNMDTDETLS